jgi:hypothetical protein
MHSLAVVGVKWILARAPGGILPEVQVDPDNPQDGGGGHHI